MKTLPIGKSWRECVCILVVALGACPHAAAEDDDAMHRGLIARYIASGRTVERIDEELQFNWAEESPDPRLPAGPFEAVWAGRWNAKTTESVSLHVYLQGEIQVSVDGQIVLQQSRDDAGWVSASAWQPGLEDPLLEIRYRKRGGRALLRLFWSGSSFPLEPLSGRHFYHEDPPASARLVKRGRALFDSLKCARCHEQPHAAPPPPAAALTRAAAHLPRDWLVKWLSAGPAAGEGRRMPYYGLGSPSAAHVAEYLNQQALRNPARLETMPEPEAIHEARRRGEVLFRSVGCLACHARDGLGQSDLALLGTRLDGVDGKRSRDWIYTWLAEPARLNADHQMPTFNLTDEERRDLACYLSQSGTPAAPEAAAAPDAELGRKIARQARCANCHQITGVEPNRAGVPAAAFNKARWSSGCVEGAGNLAKGQPAYALSAEEREALRAYLEAYSDRHSAESHEASGARLFDAKGCSQCHQRGGSSGLAALAGRVAAIDAEFAGQSELLLPPCLDGVGDKLRDESLHEAIVGNAQVRRLPWLAVRMPRYVMDDSQRRALADWLIGQDRIPPGAPEALAAPQAPASERQRAAWAAAASVIGGARGKSCVGCHRVGSHEPRNLAPATRGSNLHLLGERMRPEYFARWVRAPLRIVPNMEMPSFDKALPGPLEGNWERQISALWLALNAPTISPPFDTSTVEQVLEVPAAGRPRLVRDVFNIGALDHDAKRADQFVPRGMAMGFAGQRNLLFDLDTAAVRAVWQGGFARQRSAGKSWHWEPNASPIHAALQTVPGFVLRETKTGEIREPVPLHGRFARLLHYRVAPAGVELRYAMTFDLPQGSHELEIDEFVSQQPHTTDGRRGVTRSVGSKPPPAGYELALRDALARPAANRAARPGAPSIQPLRETSGGRVEASMVYCDWPAEAHENDAAPPAAPEGERQPKTRSIEVVPGYRGRTLALPSTIMPTGMCLAPGGRLAFCSLKGHVYLLPAPREAREPSELIEVEAGLASPYGLIADGDDLIVAHKPELLRLRDLDGDGRADLRVIVADGWGYTDDYHDWTTGIVRDSRGRLYVGTGSDYAKAGRSAAQGRNRGKVLRIDERGAIAVVGHAFRYPTGLAINAADQVFVTDNQGVQNPFNEINLLEEGAYYGVPALFEDPHEAPPRSAALWVPHPWTRSVNGIFFLGGPVDHPFCGHGIGCEYDGRFLIRFTLDWVNGACQGAVYPFSLPAGRTLQGERSAAATVEARTAQAGGFLGTLCGFSTRDGDLFVGCIHDSGWGGGANVGEIAHLWPDGAPPPGIKEIRCTREGFRLSFTAPVDRQRAAQPANYDLVGYTRVWKGGYATPDSGRHRLQVERATVAADGLAVELQTGGRQTGHLYEIRCGRIAKDERAALWPDAGYYTLHKIPD